MTPNREHRFLQWRFILPPEKGGWVWWLGPLVAGVIVAGAIHVDFVFVLIAAVCGFCARQPAAIALKVLRRPRRRADLAPATAWALGYGGVLIGMAIVLYLRQGNWVLIMGVPCALILGLHLWLTWLGKERRQVLVDITAAGTLALTGPAAYWSCGGEDNTAALLLWLLPALQSAASIVHVMLKLEQRRLKTMPSWGARWRSGAPSLIFHAANAVVGVGVYAAGGGNVLVLAAFLIPAVDGVHAVTQPPVRDTPMVIGMRQLGVSSAFMLLVGFGLG